MMPRNLPLICILLGSIWTGAFAQGVNDGPSNGIIDLTPLLDGGAIPTPNEAAAPQADTNEGKNASLPTYFRPKNTALASIAEVERTLFYPTVSATGVQIKRLSGEYDELALSITVPPSASIDRFVITYRNSINVLGSESRIVALLDGVEIASWAPEAPSDFETVELPVTALKEGNNQLIIRATQSHRIFCGPEASFAIWTDIDPARSGINVILGEETVPDINGFRRAAQAQLAINGRLPVITALPLSAETTRDLEQRVSALSGTFSGRLALQSPYDLDTTPKALARISIISGSSLTAQTPLPALTTDPDGALILVLSDDTSKANLNDLLPLPGIMTGPPRLTPGTTSSLEQLNVETIALRSRYERRIVPFQLPDDWLIISSQQARITLLYRYIDSLPEGALMLVKVNDKTVRMLPLFGQGDTVLPPLVVGFPARMLQPGMNAISFEAIVPGTPPDLPCPHIEAPFVEISGDTTLDVPPSPRMQFPRLSRSVLSLAPDRISLVPALFGDSRAEALLTNLMVGLPTIDTTNPTPSTLTVSTLATLDQVPLGTLGINRLTIEQALSPSVNTPTLLPSVASRFAAPEPTMPSYRQKASNILSQSWAWLSSLAWPGDRALPSWIAPRNGVALIFMPDAAHPDDLWLVTGPNADSEALTSALSNGRVDPFGPDGQAALLSTDGDWQNWHPASTRPQMLEALTFSNIRNIAGNYASWAPIIFVGLLATLMSISVLLGLSFVVNTRGARKR